MEDPDTIGDRIELTLPSLPKLERCPTIYRPVSDYTGLAETTQTRSSARWASIFGGSAVEIGSRTIEPTTAGLGPAVSSSGLAKDGEEAVEQQIEAEEGADIKYRSCSWPKTAALLFSEYICMAIMSFPKAYSDMGWVSGVIFTLANAVVYQYTSLVLWEFCLRHPEVRDMCDFGFLIFGAKKWAWWATASMFVFNNTFVMGLHVIVGAQYLETITQDWTISICKPVLFGFLVTFLCWLGSLLRTFDVLSHLATISAVFTFFSVLMAAIFVAIQDAPANYDPSMPLTVSKDGTVKGGEPIFSPWPAPGTTLATYLVALLNIGYTFVGQIALPSFIAEMKDPRDFPKALWTCTIGEVAVFTAIALVIYRYTGMQYLDAPAYGGLEKTYKIVAFSLMVPNIIFLGILYASITGRFVFFRLFRDSEHLSKHTLKGWLS